MNDPVGCVGVNPVEATSCRHLADVSGNRHGVPVIEQDQVLMNVDPVAFHRVARDAGDGITLTCAGPLARAPLRATELRKGERGAREHYDRTRSGHGETPGLDLRNLLPGVAARSGFFGANANARPTTHHSLALVPH